MKKRENMPARRLRLRGRLTRGRGRRRRASLPPARGSQRPAWASPLPARQGWRRLVRRDLAARYGDLEAVDHDPVVRAQALIDDPQALVQGADLDHALLDHVRLVDDQQVVAALVDAKRAIGHQERLVGAADRDPHPDEQAGQENIVLVRDHAARLQGPGALVDIARHVIERRFMGIAGLVLEADAELDRLDVLERLARRSQSWHAGAARPARRR